MIGQESIAAGIAEFEALGSGPAGQRYRRFVLEYVADPRRNATRAYQIAYDTKNYDSARANASKLLAKANISAAVEALQNKIRETALDRILLKLEAIIHTELRDVMTWSENGQIKLVSSAKLSPQASAALAMIQEVREEQPKLPGLESPEDRAVEKVRKCVKLHDPLKAIEVYAKLAGIGGAERINISGIDESIRAAWARIAADGPRAGSEAAA